MKDIIPALADIQIICMDRSRSLDDLGAARKRLFAAIREALIDITSQDPHSFIVKFDKLNSVSDDVAPIATPVVAKVMDRPKTIKVDKQLCLNCHIHPKHPTYSTNGCVHRHEA